ncbi:MAG TPA: RnfH family protein [Comamonadaceae bacterium]|uniref:RnfH family protein n=1 Tax=Pulveribacter sp. TaxID=2678893 RepID=UPI000EB84C03|nr:RnfH family protein [Pulveribacter sp.]HCL86172.1 RnfH family protein [Comamonadaceae bacterium]
MADAPLRVTVSASLQPGQVQEWQLRLPAGATVAQALAAAGLQQADLAPLALGIWGRSAEPGAELRDGDRVECCRALTVDPKIARRQRFASQGARAAGLFARRRPGAKQGY